MIFRLLVISTFILSQAAAVYGATIQTTVNSIPEVNCCGDWRSARHPIDLKDLGRTLEA